MVKPLRRVMPQQRSRLKRSLNLFDVFVLSTGAMFSSGFFLLPGIAAGYTGPSVVLAYFVSGLMILPAMFSMAELTTAMPRAGGSYYFIDRSMGPLAGTVGGLGTWISLVLKSAFALIGMGVYLGLYLDIDIKPLAVGLTVAFVVLNVVGAKESSGLQRLLVVILLAVLGYYVAQGVTFILQTKGVEGVRQEFTPFFTDGLGGFATTVGLVFVSYAGLTKVASVAEEVIDPDRSIPLGMILSVITATVIYCVGVFIMVTTLEPSAFRDDLTPVATSAMAFFDWIPGGGGVLIIVIAAVAAFASTGNAGILSASRYPLAMARDRLLPDRFGRLGKHTTPTFAIMITAGAMCLIILFLDITIVAKLASAFQLVVFGIINLCVIVMRESKLKYYHPGFRSPLYPWMQIAGVLIPIWLIYEMGWLATLFSNLVIFAGVGWYFYYARGRVQRHGAIFHVFERLGRLRDAAVDRELRTVMGEKGLKEDDPFEAIVARAEVLDLSDSTTFDALVDRVAERLGGKGGPSAEALAASFRASTRAGLLELADGVAAPTLMHAGVDSPQMALVRCQRGVHLAPPPAPAAAAGELTVEGKVYAFVFLVSAPRDLGVHLRVLAHIATHVEEEHFLDAWLAADRPEDLRRILLRDERFLHLAIRPSGATADLLGKTMREIGLPQGVLVALVRRRDKTFVPEASIVLEAGDRLTIIGNPDGMRAVAARFPD